MSRRLVPSLLQALVLTDGEALVMHVGERPYVVAECGQVPLAKLPLTLASIADVMAELVPAAARPALVAGGATQFVLPEYSQLPGERFSVVAARASDDAWIEIRRITAAGPAPNPASESGGRSRVDRRAAPTADHSSIAMRVAGAEALSVVVPLTRMPVRPDPRVPRSDPTAPTLERLLRVAAARGASALYLMSGATPCVRIDGEVRSLDGFPLLDAAEVEALLLSVRRERSGEELRVTAEREWVTDMDGLGRVRCQSFRDSRGPGGVFRLLPGRVVSTTQLGLSAEVVALADGRDGLVLVAGPRSGGKRTLMSALVDHVNRSRRVHVVTIGREPIVSHEPVLAMISQREVARQDQVADAVQRSLREDPDVLVLEELGNAELVTLALEAAVPGRLVIAGVAARSAGAAVDALIDVVPPASRPRTHLALAHALRGVVAQVLVKKVGGGRLAARELLLNTPAVSGLLAEGRTSQLPLAIEGGRAHGMVALNDALAAFVQAGIVDVREACSAAADRAGLVALLQRNGVDVSQIERAAASHS